MMLEEVILDPQWARGLGTLVEPDRYVTLVKSDRDVRLTLNQQDMQLNTLLRIPPDTVQFDRSLCSSNYTVCVRQHRNQSSASSDPPQSYPIPPATPKCPAFFASFFSNSFIKPASFIVWRSFLCRWSHTLDELLALHNSMSFICGVLFAFKVISVRYSMHRCAFSSLPTNVSPAMF